MADGAPCLVKIGYDDANPDSEVEIIAESPEKISKKGVESSVREIFSLNHDLNLF